MIADPDDRLTDALYGSEAAKAVIGTDIPDWGNPPKGFEYLDEGIRYWSAVALPDGQILAVAKVSTDRIDPDGPPSVPYDDDGFSAGPVGRFNGDPNQYVQYSTEYQTRGRHITRRRTRSDILLVLISPPTADGGPTIRGVFGCGDRETISLAPHRDGRPRMAWVRRNPIEYDADGWWARDLFEALGREPHPGEVVQETFGVSAIERLPETKPDDPRGGLRESPIAEWTAGGTAFPDLAADPEAKPTSLGSPIPKLSPNGKGIAVLDTSGVYHEMPFAGFVPIDPKQPPPMHGGWFPSFCISEDITLAGDYDGRIVVHRRGGPATGQTLCTLPDSISALLRTPDRRGLVALCSAKTDKTEAEASGRSSQDERLYLIDWDDADSWGDPQSPVTIRSHSLFQKTTYELNRDVKKLLPNAGRQPWGNMFASAWEPQRTRFTPDGRLLVTDLVSLSRPTADGSRYIETTLHGYDWQALRAMPPGHHAPLRSLPPDVVWGDASPGVPDQAK